MILTIPNILTLLRIVLVPWMASALFSGNHDRALVLFAVAGLTDALDGFIARRFGMTSRLGSFLDPAADKVLVVVMVIVTASQSLIPSWLAALIVGRDVMIVSGVLLWYLKAGEISLEPSLTSKVNMGVQVVFILIVIASAGGYVRTEPFRGVLCALSAASAVVSGLGYYLTWIHRFRDLRRSGR